LPGAWLVAEHLSSGGRAAQGRARVLDGGLPRAAARGGAGGEGLQATTVAAGAAGSHRTHRHVAELPARALSAAQEHAAQKHAVRDHTAPGPQGKKDEVVHLASRPEPEIAPRRGARVVLDRERETDFGPNPVFEQDALDGVQIRGEGDTLFSCARASPGTARQIPPTSLPPRNSSMARPVVSTSFSGECGVEWRAPVSTSPSGETTPAAILVSPWRPRWRSTPHPTSSISSSARPEYLLRAAV